DYSDNDPVNRTDPSGLQGGKKSVPPATVVMTRVQGVTDRPFCGGARMEVAFRLSPNPGVKGVIVQKVNFVIRALTCCAAGNLANLGFSLSEVPNRSYWEAWDVDAKGLVTPLKVVGFTGFDVIYFNDVFKVCDVPNSCGDVQISGSLAFFPGKSTKFLQGKGWQSG